MKALILPVLVSLSAAGGVFTANMLGGGGSDHGAPSADAYDSVGYGKEGDAKAHGDKGHGAEETAPAADFMKFKRQFVVPVMKDEAVEALVLLNLGLEFEESKRDEIFRKEPRYRDAFIRELLQLSDKGFFNEEMTSPDTYEVVRETLLRAAKTVDEKGISDVLILDFSRQDR